ncbi:LysR family transcriptional regulator [Paracoccus liaowanqingii]|uniref:LysR family transcriptional regulator n=1 Tax=Paracoccus liaowanqingii TaxID=2560053 RepID=A0A4Z1BYC6_9RHOB|nr:LysR family transcriptional regulator [Paracoccus liaowanqingii]TGN56397.1 LysR family transcriptional regulator [Paracoccus liaowanqingii]
MEINSLTLLRRMTARARLRHMQALIALDDLRSMKRAAEAMDITQPAMSQLVAELEQLLETTLYLRHSRGVTPTRAAIDLLTVARRIIAATGDGAELIASHSRRDRGLVRLGVSVAAESGLLQDTLPVFARRHPDIQVHIESLVGPGLDASFTSDAFDIIACRWRPIVPADWEYVSCLQDMLEVICASSHPLAARTMVTDADLQDATWLTNHVASVAREHFDDFTRTAGWTIRNKVQIISRVPGVILPLVASGGLLCLMPRSMVKPWIDDGRLVILATPLCFPLPDVGFYWRRAETGTASSLLANQLKASAQTTAGASTT